VKLTRTVALALVAAAVVALGGLATWFSHEDYRLYVVKTGSMTPTYDAGDVVVDRPASVGYQPRDVLTFDISGSGDLVTHRFTHLDKQGRIHTKGDNNKVADSWELRPEQVRGVVTSHVPNLGYVIVFLRQPAGVAGVMTATLAVFLLWGLCFPAQTTAAPAAASKRPRAPLWVPQQRLAPVSPWAMAPARVQPAVLRIPPPRPVSRVRHPLAARAREMARDTA
jgi:signal peptidase I